MNSSQRIVVNTIAQYTRTIINVGLSLYATRLILLALGQTDFGIYSVVAGVVTMLSFMTNALISTTQRYLSFNHGKGDKTKVYQVFGNSVLLHLFIGLGLLVVLGALAYPVIYSVLHIEPTRLTAAMSVYIAAVVMLLLAFLTAPFRALFIARENIVYISVIDVIDGILRLLIAIFLTFITYDKLISYAVLMTGISVFNLLAFAIYALRHFEECHIPRWRELDKTYLRDLSSFAGWTIYSTGCILARTQGLAIILNRFFGSVINAAYGIAQQVTGAVQFVAQSVMNAMSPQIMKAEGAGERQRMLSLAESSSKYATLLMAIAAIPLVFEMPEVLRFWLKEVPDDAVMFCRFVLVASVCDQLTIGLGTANQAIGQIRNYSLVINTIKVLTLPAAWLGLYLGLPAVCTMWCYVGFELTCALARLVFLKMTAGLCISQFVKNVFGRSLVPIGIMTIACYACVRWMEFPCRFLLTIVICGVVGSIAIWFVGLTGYERNTFKNNILSKFFKK